MQVDIKPDLAVLTLAPFELSLITSSLVESVNEFRIREALGAGVEGSANLYAGLVMAINEALTDLSPEEVNEFLTRSEEGIDVSLP